ncbi:MAG: ABC transporter ATP-binding protein [Bacteroidota bacterium]|nr:ABC transporter ATP-binding protein [Bacteroidota bacterium]MDP3145928.1 ABC transporter ATP-binding protein [Bacteroidota bacterium]
MADILQIKNVSKKYSNHVALNDISINVAEKSIFGLLGPNGAGKTSLIRIINQITGPDKGEILFKGEKLNPKHVERIGYLPEERGLYKKMSVGDQVLYLAQLKGLSKTDAKKRLSFWFEKFEMQSWWKKKIEELSKGMQQKVQFIVTVIHEPELLILDEPFSGFDPINAQLIKNEILELRKNGATVIFSTHNMGSVEELCDNICLINKAEKILDGSVKDIRKTFRTNTYKISFKGNLLGFTNALWTAGEIVEKHTEDEIHTVTLKLANTITGSQFLQAVLPTIEIHSFNELIPSMNDIFIMKVNQGNEVVGTKSNYTE